MARQKGPKGPIAGWYQDPTGQPLFRWWDGHQWTAYTQPVEPPQPPVNSPQPDLPRPQSDRPTPAQQSTPPQVASSAPSITSDADVAEVVETDPKQDHRGLFGARKRLEVENERLRAELAATTREQIATQIDELRNEVSILERQRDELKARVVAMTDAEVLQEVGIYEYHHPLSDSIAFKARLAGLQKEVKDSVRAGTAVKGSTTWTVNGSSRDGARMVKEFSKLMLRAYNNEADSAVRSMKPYTLESSIARLEKARDTIVKLGHTMNIRITDHYHELRLEELRLTADYLAKVAEEKERERAERERRRDEEAAAREIAREQDRLRREQAHYAATLTGLRANAASQADIEHAEAKLAEVDDALDGITRRAANLRAGWVYVISNVGAFGPKVVKIGMTRRLDPMDRINELGDASVPFRYDVHATISSDDAVSLETSLHHALAERRVNLVNQRREFFYTTPGEVRELLEGLNASLVSFTEEPAALEWHQSENTRTAGLTHRTTEPMAPEDPMSA